LLTIYFIPSFDVGRSIRREADKCLLAYGELDVGRCFKFTGPA